MFSTKKISGRKLLESTSSFVIVWIIVGPMFLISLFIFVTALLLQPASDDFLFNGNILLLTAHPDDECMFFAPTIRALIRTNADIYSLCLSTGNADRKGNIRREEFSQSLDILGIPVDKRWIIDSPDLPDNFTIEWNATTIASVMRPIVLNYNITTIFTFDSRGVSGHPNHRSLPFGVLHLLKDHASINLYSLVTRPLYAKYTGVISPLWAKYNIYQSRVYPLLRNHINRFVFTLDDVSDPDSKESNRQPLVVVSGIDDYLSALKAMRAHASQLVWFRYLYLLFSRYMWVNEWTSFDVEIHA